MDNLPVLKTTGIREAIERRGARLRFLQTYSPDFNLIQKSFAKLEALLRKAAVRTIPEFRDVIANALDAFTPTECANVFANSGYEP
jgi:transposase